MKALRIPLRLNAKILKKKPHVMWLKWSECDLEAGEKIMLCMPWGVPFATAVVEKVDGPLVDGERKKPPKTWFAKVTVGKVVRGALATAEAA